MSTMLLIRVFVLAVLIFLFAPDAPNDAAAANTGNLSVALLYADGTPIANRYIEILSGSGEYVTIRKTSEFGRMTVNLEQGLYMIQPYFRGYDFSERWNIAVEAGRTTYFTYTLGRLTVTLRFGDGTLMKNSYISLHEQGSDADGNLVEAKMVQYISTRDTGTAIFDLTPGVYAIKVDPELNGYEWPKRNLVVEPGRINDSVFSLGRISVTPRRADGTLLKDTLIKIAYEEKDIDGNRVEGQTFFYSSTGNKGTASFDVNPGVYVLSYYAKGERVRQFGVPALSGTVTLSDGFNVTGFQPPWQTPSAQNMSVTLNWSLSRGTTQYQLEVVPANNDGPAINLIRAPEESFTIAAPKMGQGNYVLLPDMTYSWRVRSSNTGWRVFSEDVGWGPWSEFHTFKTPTVSSNTITPVSLPEGGVSHKLQWADSNESVFYYEIQASSDPAFGEGESAIASVWHNLVHGGFADPLNSWQTPPLQANTTYYWRVRPRVQGDGSPVAWSQTWSFHTGQN